MEVKNTLLTGVKIISLGGKKDVRGKMDVVLDEKRLKDQGIDFTCVHQRIYSAPMKHTFYGIHFQTALYPQAKMIYCIAGRGIDYIVDLNKESPTYKKWIAIEICGEDDIHIFIPQGYGHAFFTLEDNTMQLFSANANFNSEGTRNIRYNDKEINIIYPRDIEHLSDNDQKAPYLKDIKF